MTELEKLREEKEKFISKFNKHWFKIKLREDMFSHMKSAMRRYYIAKDFPEDVERFNEISEQIAELEMQEIDAKIQQIWNED